MKTDKVINNMYDARWEHMNANPLEALNDRIMHKVLLYYANKKMNEYNKATDEKDMLKLFLSPKQEKVTRSECDLKWEEYRATFTSMILKGVKEETYNASEFPGSIYAMLNISRRPMDRPQDIPLDSQGNTALHICAYRWNRNKIDLLLMDEVFRCGVDWSIKNKDGLTAEQVGDQEFKQLVKDWRKQNG